MFQKLPEGREGWVQPAKPGALAEAVMLEQNPEGGQSGSGGERVGHRGPQVSRWVPWPACVSKRAWLRMKSEGMGRPLTMRLRFPGGPRGPQG